jgi:hypothetical protein
MTTNAMAGNGAARLNEHGAEARDRCDPSGTSAARVLY